MTSRTARRASEVGALAFGLCAGVAAADVPEAVNLPRMWADAAVGAPPADAGPRSRSVDDAAAATIEAHKSYVIPALEIVGFDLLVNLVNRPSSSDYHSNFSSIRRNLRSSWVVDQDPFQTNQLGHPYQGSMYQGFARSAGLGYWESLLYTFAGSAFWEIAGETTPPSINDQIASGVGGSFLGEILFRLSNLVLEHDSIPPFWRELGAAVVSPATGFNRLAFGDRFKTVFPSHDPVYYSRLQIGYSSQTQNESGTSTTNLKRNEGVLDYSIDYGLPGKPGYTYTRPFDYFVFQATTSTANGFESLLTRGLLLGKDYEAGSDYRGVWGLYGNYDYIAPQTYRVSSTGLSLGTTGQWWMSPTIALQGSLLGGAGYTATGTTLSTSNTDYHYGLAPQALASLRLIFGERASLDVTGREYFVTRVGSAARGGHDNIVRLDAGFTVRIYRQHGVTVKYVGNRRDAFYPDVGDRSQSRSTLGIFYTWLGHDRFGVVEWR